MAAQRSDGSKPDISVIVATRNRATHLGEALDALAAQETDDAFTFEVLVMDNATTDETPRLVASRQARFPSRRLRYLREERVGKPWALNTGMAQAAGELLAFTDDDILPSPTWLAAMRRCLTEERADAVAGRVIPKWTGPRPAWLTDEAVGRIGTIGCVDHGAERRFSRRGQDCRWVGGSLLIRREAARLVGPYDVRMVVGEDKDYYERSVARGLAVCYEPAALVQHKVSPARVELRFLRTWYHRTGYYYWGHCMPWKWHHLFTVAPLWWYGKTLRLLLVWLQQCLAGRSWVERFRAELHLRQALSAWWRRLQLWPRWWLTVATGRSHLP